MQLVFAEEDCILSVDAEGDDAHHDAIAATLLEAAGATDAAEAERYLQGALGDQARIERR
jgi:hypothetical protein